MKTNKKERGKVYQNFNISWIEIDLIYNALGVRMMKIAKEIKSPYHSETYRDFLRYELRNSYKLFIRFVCSNYPESKQWRKNFFKSFKNELRKEATKE